MAELAGYPNGIDDNWHPLVQAITRAYGETPPGLVPTVTVPPGGVYVFDSPVPITPRPCLISCYPPGASRFLTKGNYPILRFITQGSAMVGAGVFGLGAQSENTAPGAPRDQEAFIEITGSHEFSHGRFQDIDLIGVRAGVHSRLLGYNPATPGAVPNGPWLGYSHFRGLTATNHSNIAVEHAVLFDGAGAGGCVFSDWVTNTTVAALQMGDSIAPIGDFVVSNINGTGSGSLIRLRGATVLNPDGTARYRSGFLISNIKGDGGILKTIDIEDCTGFYVNSLPNGIDAVHIERCYDYEIHGVGPGHLSPRNNTTWWRKNFWGGVTNLNVGNRFIQSEGANVVVENMLAGAPKPIVDIDMSASDFGSCELTLRSVGMRTAIPGQWVGWSTQVWRITRCGGSVFVEVQSEKADQGGLFRHTATQSGTTVTINGVVNGGDGFCSTEIACVGNQKQISLRA